MAEQRPSVCPHDCPSACSLVVTLEGGRITDVSGNPDHPFTQGVICGKVHDYAERVYTPLRVPYSTGAAEGYSPGPGRHSDSSR